MATGQPHREEILQALERIGRSAALGRSERLCRFLRFVIGQTLEGKGEQLKEYLIGVEVFDKGETFDPRTDSAVRVDSGRQTMARAYRLLGRPAEAWRMAIS